MSQTTTNTINKKKKTSTSEFGVSGRFGHDSSKFYNSKLYDNIELVDVQQDNSTISNDLLNKLYCSDSRQMSNIPDNSLHLMITSPPYNVSKEYDDDLSLDEYLNLLKDVFSETYRVLIPGGRACINIANVGRKPYIPLTSYINKIMLDIGFLMRGEIIWNKAASSGGSCAWGSWMSASNPTLRDVHEYILIFSKGNFNRKESKKNNTISRDEFLEYTKSIWTFNTVSAKKIGHPAPFPEELPRRLIQLYSYENDIVLDPFCGSGTTCISAKKNNRFYVGFDINPDYINLAQKRLEQEFMQQKINLK